MAEVNYAPGLPPGAINLLSEKAMAEHESVTSATEILPDGTSPYIIHSPYTEQEHQLDLRSLDNENALLAKALMRLECLRDDYATAPYTETFNWARVGNELRHLVEESGESYKESAFYIVAFRSQIPPTTVYKDLGTLDKAAHAEANSGGGFLK
jgi:hypothetical protein